MSAGESGDDETTEVFIGPSQAPYWKFLLAGLVFRLVRTSRVAPYVQRLPGALHAGKWAFRVRVLSREFDTVDSDANEETS